MFVGAHYLSFLVDKFRFMFAGCRAWVLFWFVASRGNMSRACPVMIVVLHHVQWAEGSTHVCTGCVVDWLT